MYLPAFALQKKRLALPFLIDVSLIFENYPSKISLPY